MQDDEDFGEPPASDEGSQPPRSAFNGRDLTPILGDSFTRGFRSFALPTPTLVASINQTIAPIIGSLVDTARMVDVLNTSLTSWFVQTAEWAEMFSRVLAAAGVALPTNWSGIEERADPELLNRIVRDEGLPLCWVAPKEVVRRLVDAETAQARRDVIGKYSTAILRECEAQLDHVTSLIGRRYARFATASIRAVKEQHRDAGQALATNTLDSLIQRYGLKPPARNNPPDLGDFDLTDALVLGALWATYFSYQPDESNQVPREFRRHASAHGVSPRQYTLRNATIAIMHLVSVLRWLELRGFERQTKRIWS